MIDTVTNVINAPLWQITTIDLFYKFRNRAFWCIQIYIFGRIIDFIHIKKLKTFVLVSERKCFF